jgi:hypothetical protein
MQLPKLPIHLRRPLLVSLAVGLSVVAFIPAVFTLVGPSRGRPNAASGHNPATANPVTGACCGAAAGRHRPAQLLQAQASAGGVIDGSTNPGAIPDDRAYHMVLLTTAASASDTAVHQAGAASIIAKMQLQPPDATILASIANQYRTSFQAFISVGSTSSEAAYEQGRAALTAAAISDLSAQLTPLAYARLVVYTQDEKAHIKLFPFPDMTSNHAGLWDRLFPIKTVHAMNAYGTAYRTESEAGGAVYATVVTDTSASCSCHKSSSAVTIKARGGSANFSTGLVGPLAQAETVYTLTGDDFVDGTIEVDSTNYSWCPIFNGAFINSNNTDWLPLRTIEAYYYYTGNNIYNRCNPNGNCDSMIGVGNTTPQYGFFHVTEINIGPVHFCQANLQEALTKCYSPDPKP